MTEKQLEEFASTKRKGKPEHVAADRSELRLASAASMRAAARRRLALASAPAATCDAAGRGAHDHVVDMDAAALDQDVLVVAVVLAGGGGDVALAAEAAADIGRKLAGGDDPVAVVVGLAAQARRAGSRRGSRPP